MKQSARDYFYEYSGKFEGVVPWLYLDVKQLVTTAVGNLVDPIQYAQGLQMVRADDTPATQTEVDAEWRKIKALGAPAAKHGHRWVKQYTALRMTEGGMRALVARKADKMIAHLRKRFAGWDTWPADAQLGVLSLSWACGPAFNFPSLVKSLTARDFQACAARSQMNTVGNPGLKPRNEAQKILFRNAAEVERACKDPEILYYPDSIGVEDSGA